MQQSGCRGEVAAIYTAKYESWPLLRPDELAALPTEVLRASVAELDELCRQTSGGDPIADYARTQRLRVSAILFERAAQARVQALLAGTGFVGRESLINNSSVPLASQPAGVGMAPSHDDDWPVNGYVRSGNPGHSVEPASEKILTSIFGADPSTENVKGIFIEQAVRSPPRLQPVKNEPPAICTATATLSSSARTDDASTAFWMGDEGHEQPANATGVATTKCCGGGGGGGGDSDDDDTIGAAARRVAAASSGGIVAKPLVEYSHGGLCPVEDNVLGSIVTPGATALAGAAAWEMHPRHGHPTSLPTNSQRTIAAAAATSPVGTYRSDHRRGRASSNSAVQANWGSVFVVGGGRRRKRPPVRQKSADAEETPAARRAQVEKERQERRKASLRRLMARKEQRALQQEARRKRRAAASRAAAAKDSAVAARVAAAAAVTVAIATTTVATPKISEGGGEGGGDTGTIGEGREALGCEESSGDTMVGAVRYNGVVVSDGEGTLHDRPSVDFHDDHKDRTPNANDRAPPVHEAVATTPLRGRAKMGMDGGRRFPAATTSMNIAICEHDGNKSICEGGSGSESESVSGGDSSDDDELPIDQQVDEGEASQASSSDSRTRTQQVGQLRRERIPDSVTKKALQCGRNDRCGREPGHDAEAPHSNIGCRTLVDHVREPRVTNTVDSRPPFGAGASGSQYNTSIQEHVPPCSMGPRTAGESDHHCCNRSPSSPVAGASAADDNADAGTLSIGANVYGDKIICGQDVKLTASCETNGNKGTPSRQQQTAATALQTRNKVLETTVLDISTATAAEATAGGFTAGIVDRDLAALGTPADGVVVNTMEDRANTTVAAKIDFESASEFEGKESNSQESDVSEGDGDNGGTSSDAGGARKLAGPLDILPVAQMPQPPAFSLIEAQSDTRPKFSASDVQCSESGPSQPLNPRIQLAEGEANDPEKDTPWANCSARAVGPRSPAKTPHSSIHPQYRTGRSNDGVDADNLSTNGAATNSVGTPPQQFSTASQSQGRNELISLPSATPLTRSGSAGDGGGGGGGSGFNARCHRLDGGTSRGESRSLARYADSYPRFAAILSAHHNGRALTRQADCRSLPLTSKNVAAAGRNGVKMSGLTAVEEEAYLRWQWKLYSIHVRVIKDYAAVFSYGDGWSASEAAENSNSLVYSGDTSALHYRVNSKARPEVYNIVTDVLNNRCEQWEELPTGLGLKTTWNLLWTWSKPHIQYSSLLTWQKTDLNKPFPSPLDFSSLLTWQQVNHFPNSRELTRKDLLNKHISRFMAPGGRLAKEFHMMPKTFVLPHEFTLFVAAFASSGRSKRGGRDSSTGGGFDGVGSGVFSSDDEEGAGKTSGRGKGKNLWIMKPVGMSRGRGIRLIDDIKNISYADKVVLQKYIGNPLLLDGYKFDLRLYVLVTSFNPLEAFIYKEGFARLSTHLYEKGDIDNRFIHLTNSSIQRLNEEGAARDSPLHHAKTSEAGGTKTTVSYLWRRLAASGIDVGALWAGICSVIVKSLVCVEGSIPNQPNSFELFGYDVLVDDRLRPWLIEVNSSPSMARDSHVDRQVKEALIFDTVHLVDPLPFDRQKLVGVLGRRLSETDHSKAKPFKQHHRLQQQQQQGQRQQRCYTPEMGEHDPDKSFSLPARALSSGKQQHSPRRSKEEGELDRDLDDILGGRRPRKVGELPPRMGNFVRLCPGTAAHRHACRLRRKVIRPRPGDDG